MKYFLIFSVILFVLSGCSNNNNIDNTSLNLSSSTQNEINLNVPPKETDMASFSTPINYKDENRDHNMALTCSFLNETTIKKGETFSFCNTVRQSN